MTKQQPVPKKQLGKLSIQEKNKITLIIAAIIFGLFVISSIVNGISDVSNKIQTKSSTTESKEAKAKTEASKQKYKDLDTFLVGEIGAKKHYLYTASSRPSYDEVKSFIIAESKKGCGDKLTVCEYYLWDDEASYDKAVYGSDELLSGDAIEIATRNSEHLSGFMNSGDMVFYYGTTGDGSENSFTSYDKSTEGFIVF